MLKERLTLLLRACLLLSVLYVCAHVYVELNGYGVRSWGRVNPVAHRPPQHDSKPPSSSESSGRWRDWKAPSRPHVKQNRESLRWKIELEPWASESPNLEAEAFRFINYITTLQVSCETPKPKVLQTEEALESWVLCLDDRFSVTQRLSSRHCRVYSLRLGGEDLLLEKAVAVAGCEVHCFDPSIGESHLQDSGVWLHRLSVDWREPNPALPEHRQRSSRKMAAILNDFGHRQVDVLKIDMESAEWKILENLVLEGVLRSVGLLLLEVHLHWAGFEVGGDEPTVVRYWFSLLRELERAHFSLYHSYSHPDKPRLFLQKNLLNTSSTYVLGWVNTHYSPQ
ncbi:putative methyltransferase-like protein 24 [Brachyhypopomus gauderio]|uniref:putative methyltransferase-like protein 24 n=1 Tax=Brachyhypopomus gauderio TaxID=698409 RepID=UPI004041CC3A